MPLPDILAGLLDPDAYSHPCIEIELVETHISWVLLTGTYAYKVKKPVALPFVDFSTLERRCYFCAEELRLNRRFAPELYLDVVAIRRGPDGRGGLFDKGDIVEWAVRMRQFDPARSLDRILGTAMLTRSSMQAFGRQLAEIHAKAPAAPVARDEAESRVLKPVLENFSLLGQGDFHSSERAQVRALREATLGLAARIWPMLAGRVAGASCRECHGDLHLGNLVLLNGSVTAFDCLEFDPELRWIDVMCDSAFLFMDCIERGRADLGYAFIDGYLDYSGDYGGAVVLGFYATYRALVRAKVAAIRAIQMADTVAPRAAVTGLEQEAVRGYLDWAQDWMARPVGSVVLMSGFSGSGKSYLAERLVAELPGLRLRTDIARRKLGAADMADAGLSEAQRHASRYTPERINAVYDELNELMSELLAQGWTVVLDATFLHREQRRKFLDQASGAGAVALIVHCHAPRAVLESRVEHRQRLAGDASEADGAVLARQFESFEPFGPDEPVIEVDMTPELDAPRLLAIRQEILSRLTRS